MNQSIQIDKEKTAILLFQNGKGKWEERTNSISVMYKGFYYGKFTGYNIYFKGAGKKFFYNAANVRIMHKVQTINIKHLDVYVNGKLTDAERVDQFENNYYRVCGKKSSVFTKNIQFQSNKYKQTLHYFTRLAEYAQIHSDQMSPLYFLAKNFKRFSLLPDSVLMDYLKGECPVVPDSGNILVPFDFNQSQMLALKRAMKNKISVIEGPPGTGKTQTILNLIANIIYRNKNCAVISNNNTAVENVYEKLSEDGLSIIAAALGRKSNVEDFFKSDGNSEVEGFLEHNNSEAVKGDEEARIEMLRIQMRKIQEMETEMSRLEVQLIEIQNEQRHHNTFPEETLTMKQTLASRDYMDFVYRLRRRRRLWFFERWILGFKFKVKIAAHKIPVIIYTAEKRYYQGKIKELKQKIESTQSFLKKHNKANVYKEFKSLCRLLFINQIRNNFKNLGNQNFNSDSYKRNFEAFLLRYPVVLSTSHSLFNNAPKGFVFDYLIIDEASQGDLLSSVLAMSCAKNLVVVGDSRQLQQIEDEMLFGESEKLAQKYEVSLPYRYESNSILKSVKNAIAHVPTTLLKEHYRCAPDIISFCNKMFYNDELISMTRNTGQHIKIIKTVPGNHARRNPNGSGLYNQREIDEIANILAESECQDIGIISPFRHQADRIHKTYGKDRIETDTIHKFQGRQKDEIILSFVVNSLDRDEAGSVNRLNNFVTNENLLNVAISRGKSKVTAIVADKVYHSDRNIINRFIKYAEYLYGSNVSIESTVTSVFDLLYTDYTDILLSNYKKQPHKHKSELLMCDVIKQVLEPISYIGYSMQVRLGRLVQIPDSFSEEEKSYILHPWTHVDFLFYHKVSKEKLFVVEVDGIRYHEQDKKQSQHDDIKNQILRSNNIPIHRFKTNESNEKLRLTEILKFYTH